MPLATCPACKGRKVDPSGNACWGCNGHGVVDVTNDKEADVVTREGRIVDRGSKRVSPDRRIVGCMPAIVFMSVAAAIAALYFTSGLAPTLFYLSLVFGFGFGLVACFTAGRIGFHQLFYWVAGMPFQQNPQGGEARTICSLLGIPTSMSDVIAIAGNISPIKSAYDVANYVYGNFGGPLTYVSTIFGPLLCKLWFYVGVPVFLLDLIMTPDYVPDWAVSLGGSPLVFPGTVVLGYIFAFWVGAAFPTPQKRFNRARIRYETEVTKHGYWFDAYLEGSFRHSKAALQKTRTDYERIGDILQAVPIRGSLFNQRVMVLDYQSALLLAAMQDYRPALAALHRADKIRVKLKGDGIWEPGEFDSTTSQMRFLEGELNFVLGDKTAAHDHFSEALVIDKSSGDQAGIEVIQKRLKLLQRL